MIEHTLQNQTVIQTETQTEERPVPTGETVAFSWLTGEAALYILLALLAFSARLANLSAYPLDDAEAAQALVGLEVFRGGIPAEATNYSPLMVSLNSLAFFFFGPSDASARLGATLLGLSLILLPLGLRRQLGLVGALTAAGLFAFSASSIFWSRIVAGDMGVAVGAMMVLVGLVKWLEEAASYGLFLSIAGLVLLFISAVPGVTALVILGLIFAFIALLDRKVYANLQDRLAQSGITAGQGALLGLGLFVVLGTAGLFNLTGLAAVSDMFNSWLAQFGPQPQAGAGYPAILMLLFYEPLIVLFGLLGMVRSLVERRMLDWVLVIWLGLVILLDLLMGGRNGGQILLALIPMTLLAGRTIGALLGQVRAKARWDAEGLLIGFGLILSVFIYISLTSWSKCVPSQTGCDTAWILPAAGLTLMMVLATIFGFWYGISTPWRGMGVVLLVAVGLFSLGATWRLNYGPLKDLPFQPLVSQPAATRLLTLVDDLRRLSTAQTGDPHQLELAIVNLDRPILRWHLRDFKNARFVPQFAAAGEPPVIVAAAAAGEPLGESYVGQDLALIEHWSPRLVEGKDWIRWYLFRFLPNHRPGSDEVILWINEQVPIIN